MQLAIIKVIHARSGVPHEIMGLMQGKVVGTSLVIIDSFALPVQGTETRVNAQNEANEYMVQYIQGSERVSFICILYIYAGFKNPFRRRYNGWRTPLDGITRIQAMAVGFLVSMSTPR